MRKTLIAGALGSLIVVTGVLAAPAQADPVLTDITTKITPVTGQVVPGEYIVTTKPGTARTHDVDAMIAVYEHAIHGFAAKLSPAQLRELQRDPSVIAIEPNQVARIQSDVTPQAVQTPTPNWGVDRMDQRNLPLDNSYTYFNNGTGVTAYVLDTGIHIAHPQFGGRAAVSYDALGGNGLDCNGHGTHLAGTIGSALYGVAKNVQLRSVRVINCNGSGSFADVIEGVEWVRVNSPGPSVALMALGGTESPSVDLAVSNLANSGVFVAVSGGSSASDACNFSPQGAPGAYSVIRTTQTDQSPASNNFGPCIKMQAPGTNIISTWLNNGTANLSGTSMAAAHAAGLAAMFKDAVGDTPSAVVGAWISGVATPGVLTGVHPASPNLLLYTNLI